MKFKEKFSISLLIFTICFQKASTITADEDKVFQDYIEKFEIRLGRSRIEVDRVRSNVIQRYQMINEHNERFLNGSEIFELELNKFSYLSNEELGNKVLGIRHNETIPQSMNAIPVKAISNSLRNAREALLPAYWNWNDYGIIRPVQDQGLCSSCYAFAAIAAIEAVACKNRGQCQKLSEQEAMECTALCSGGWDDWIYSYSVTTNGCTSSTYAYFGYKRQECSSAKSRKRIGSTKVKGWYLLPNDEATIRDYLFHYGPVFVTFNVYDNFYSYKSGIYTAIEGDWSGVHAVLLTGYGSDKGVDYWILKNSWGFDFGESGYFRMIRGKNLCNLEGWKLTIPIVN